VPHREQEGDTRDDDTHVDVIVFGLGRYGNNLANGLRERGWNVLGVDFDPEAVRTWHQQGWFAHYGDAEDPEFSAILPLQQARWIVSAIPAVNVNVTLLHGLRQHGYAGQVAVTAHTAWEATRLRTMGADLVLLPFTDAAAQAVELLTTSTAANAERETGVCLPQVQQHS
jgi:Trk K+ transport system NAD-binding subunit